MVDVSQIFKDEKKQLSTIRVGSFFSLFYAFFIYNYTLTNGIPPNVELFVGLLSAAFGPKVYMKFVKGETGAKQQNGK